MSRRCWTGGDLDAAVERSELTLDDADAVRDLTAFLEDAGQTRPIPMWVLAKHQGFLGLTDQDLDRAEENRRRAGHPQSFLTREEPTRE